MSAVRKDDGMTLMEVLVSILVLSLLIAAMGTGVDAAMKIYEASLFEADSGLLGQILNTALGDVLGYSGIMEKEDGQFVFANAGLGVYGGIVCETEGTLYLQSDAGQRLLVNLGVYGDLRVTDFSLLYIPEDSYGPLIMLDGKEITAGRGGFWYASYTITDGTRVRKEEIAVRPLNGA